MKNKTLFMIMGLILVAFIGYYTISTIISQKAIEGYWCNYDATGSIIVSFKTKYASDDKNKVEKYIKSIKGLERYDFVTKEEFAQNNSSQEAQYYDTYFVYFADNQEITSIVKKIKAMTGIFQVTEQTVKSNLQLYNFENKHFNYYNAVYTKAISQGKYSFKKDKITLENEAIIYVKNDYLCGDKECNQIFTKTNEICE